MQAGQRGVSFEQVRNSRAVELRAPTFGCYCVLVFVVSWSSGVVLLRSCGLILRTCCPLKPLSPVLVDPSSSPSSSSSCGYRRHRHHISSPMPLYYRLLLFSYETVLGILLNIIFVYFLLHACSRSGVFCILVLRLCFSFRRYRVRIPRSFDTH